MIPSARLAWKYVMFHRRRTAVIVACLILTLYLPAGMRILVDHFQQQLTSRAESTPLVIGAAGSRFDLALHAMYFRGETANSTSMRELNRIAESGYADAIPLHVRFQATDYPIVGTSLDYFTMRLLHPEDGTLFRRLGDCVIGSHVASTLNLAAGDSLVSDPIDVFALDGPFPLKMRVSGVLAESGTPDDDAVFVDVHTAWIIEGIGHGHDPVQPEETLQPPNNGTSDTEHANHHSSENPQIATFAEVTDANVNSFHFHGRPEDFPLTAILASVDSERNETLLMGLYLSPDELMQVLEPMDAIDELLRFVVRLQKFFDLLFVVLTVVTTLFVVLVTTLSVRLRQREFETMFRIGCSRFFLVRLVALELALLFSISIIGAFGLSIATYLAAPDVLASQLDGSPM